MTLPKLLFVLLFSLFSVRYAGAQTASPGFEVATIKAAAPSPDGHTHINYPPDDRFSASNITLMDLMQWAYGMPGKQILDGSGWLSSTRFDIQAKSDIGDKLKGLTAQQGSELKRRMVQGLLADRFQLKVHQETRMLPAYDLVLAKGGSKLQPSQSNGKSVNGGGRYFDGEGLTMEVIADQLSRISGRVVVDKTGLAGRFDLKLRWTPDDAVPGEADPPTLFTAIQEELGLRLEPAKEPVPVLVVDHVDQPTPN